MADERIVTSIVANSDFSNLVADVQRVTSSLFKLQQELAGTNRALSGQIDAANAMFNQTMLKTGQFSSHFVSLTSDVEKFGRNLDGGRLKLKDYFRVYQENARTTGGLIRDLAKQQVQLQNAVLQPLGKNAQGLMQYNVHIPRGLDLTKNKAALLKQELQIMNKVIQDGGVQLINWGKNTQWAGRQLTVGLTLPLVAFGKAAADAFKVADQELTRLTKVYGDIAGTSSQELGRIRKEVTATAKELSSAMGVNFAETISLAADIAATGKTGNELLSSVSETTRLAVLGEVDRQEAMKATLAIQSAFKANTEQLAESINFLNAVENQTSTTLNDLVEAIPKAGPVIKGLGGNVQDLALYLTAMREGGINASEGANALKSALASLINPTDVAVAKFKGLGIDLLGIVNKNAGDVTQTLFALQAALDRLDPLQKQQAIEQLFGKFQFSRLNALFENLGRQGSQTLQVLDLMKASASELESVATRELSAVTESAAGRYRRAVESLKADLAGVGDEFLNIATKLVNFLSKIIEFGQKLPDPIKKIIAFGGAFTAIIGPIIMLTGVLANFFGYIIKGIGHFKALFKGAEGFKLLTPEILAAKAAGSQLSDEFYSDALAADTLSLAIKKLSEDLVLLQKNATSAKSASAGLGQVLTTTAGSPIVPFGPGQRMVNPEHPLLGPRSRAAAHLNPRDPNNPATIFGMTLAPIPVNRTIGANPQILMEERLPDFEGVTTIKGVSTGVVAAEHARYQALMATLGLQSKKEIQDLKKTIAMGGQVSSEFMATFDDILPITQKLTQNAATQSAAIVAQLHAGKLSAQQARDAIIAVNAQLERELGIQISAYGAARGKTIDLTKAPLIDQPVVDATGKPNVRGMYRKGIFGRVMDVLGRATRTRTLGGPYSIETTRPIQRNTGGDVFYNNGDEVPGPNINADVVPAMLTPGEFVIRRDIAQADPDGMRALNAGQAMVVPFGANRGGQVPEIQKLNFGNLVRRKRVSDSKLSRGTRSRDIVRTVLGIKAKGPQAQAFIAQIGQIKDREIREKTRQIVAKIAERKTRSRVNPEDYSPVAKTIQEKNAVEINDALIRAGLPPLPYAAPMHGTHLTVSKKTVGGTMVSDYTVGYSATSNLQANANTLRPDDFIKRDLVIRPGFNKYDRQLQAAGVPADKWGQAEKDIDALLKLKFTGQTGTIGDRPELGAKFTFTKDVIPTIESVIKKYNPTGIYKKSYRDLKTNRHLRKTKLNSGGKVPGYNRGGNLYGYARGIQNKNAGGAILKLLAALGISMAGQEVGSRVGGKTGSAISFASSILPFLIGGGGFTPGATRAIGQRLGLGATGAQTNAFGGQVAQKLPVMKQSIFAQSTPILGKFSNALGTTAVAGNLLTRNLAKLAIGISRTNVALAAGAAAVYGLYKAWQNYKKTQELSATQFGMTADAAEKAGLKFTDYGKKLKDAVESQKLLIAQNKLTYQSMASAGTPFNLTITEYKKLRKEVKETMSTQIEMLNAIGKEDVQRVAIQLKEQFISMGLSAEEASKRIYTLFQLSDKASLTTSAMGTKGFSAIIDAQTAAVSALKTFNFAVINENTKDQARALNTALMSIDAGITQIMTTAEKASLRKKEDFDITEQSYKAETKMLDLINSKVTNQREIGNDVLETWSKQDPLINRIINAQDNVVSIWQKMRIAARGYTGDLSNLTIKETERLYNAQIKVAKAVEQATSQGILSKQISAYNKLKDQIKGLEEASRGQSIKEQINSRDAIRAIDKKIKKINEESEARKKALREETEAEDLALQIQKQRLEYEKYVSAGDFTSAAEARLELERLLKDQQLTIAERQIEENRIRKVTPLEKEKERRQSADEKLADKAALASENLESLRSRASKLEETFDKVNTSISTFLFSRTKENAAALIQALKDAGVKIGVGSFKSSPGPSDILNPLDYANKFIDKISESFSDKGIVFNANKDIIINGKVISAPPAGSFKNPFSAGSTKDYDKRLNLDNWNAPHNIFPWGTRGQVKDIAAKNNYKPGDYFSLLDHKGKNYIFKVREDGNITLVKDPYKMAKGGPVRLSGGGPGEGGPVNGPGTSTSDSIPAYLSKGEFVMNAAAVDHYGEDTMYMINARKFSKGGGVADRLKNFAKKSFNPKVMMSSALYAGMENSERYLSRRWGANEDASDMSKWGRALGRVAFDSLQGGVAGLPWSKQGFIAGSGAGLVEGLIGLARDGSQFGVKGGSAGFNPNYQEYTAKKVGSDVLLSTGIGLALFGAGSKIGSISKNIKSKAIQSAAERQGIFVLDERLPNMFSYLSELGYLPKTSAKRKFDDALTEYQKLATSTANKERRFPFDYISIAPIIKDEVGEAVKINSRLVHSLALNNFENKTFKNSMKSMVSALNSKTDLPDFVRNSGYPLLKRGMGVHIMPKTDLSILIHEMGHRQLNMSGGPKKLESLLPSKLLNDSGWHEGYADSFQFRLAKAIERGALLGSPTRHLEGVKSPFLGGSSYGVRPYGSNSPSELAYYHLLLTQGRPHQRGPEWLDSYRDIVNFMSRDPLDPNLKQAESNINKTSRALSIFLGNKNIDHDPGPITDLYSNKLFKEKNNNLWHLMSGIMENPAYSSKIPQMYSPTQLIQVLESLSTSVPYNKATPQDISSMLQKLITPKETPKFAVGGYVNPSFTPSMNLPSFSDGVNNLYSDTVAQLHKNEAVIPKEFNPWNPTASNPLGNTITINTPVTVNAAPWMDTQDIINQVTSGVLDANARALAKVGIDRNISTRYN